MLLMPFMENDPWVLDAGMRWQTVPVEGPRPGGRRVLTLSLAPLRAGDSLPLARNDPRLCCRLPPAACRLWIVPALRQEHVRVTHLDDRPQREAFVRRALVERLAIRYPMK